MFAMSMVGELNDVKNQFTVCQTTNKGAEWGVIQKKDTHPNKGI